MFSTMAVKLVRAGLKVIPLALTVVGLAVSAYWIGLVHAQREALNNAKLEQGRDYLLKAKQQPNCAAAPEVDNLVFCA